MYQPLNAPRQRSSRLARWGAAVGLAATAWLLSPASWATTALAADNTLASSSPAADSVIPTSPTSLLLTFTNPVGRANTVEATCGGAIIALGSPQLTPDGLSLSIAVPTPMPKGQCAVAWRVSQPDGTPGGQGSLGFTIEADTVAAPATTPTTGADPGATAATTVAPTAPASPGSPASAKSTADGGTTGPLGLTRLMVTLGLAALFGALVLIAVAWPEGVEYILTVRFLRTASAVAVIGAFLNVVTLRAHVTGEGLGASLSPTTWGDLTDFSPGIAAIARLLLAAASVWVVLRPDRVNDPSTLLAALALPGAAVATLGFSRSGGDLAAVGALMGVVHALAMAVWFGGLVLLARVVLAGPGEDDLVHAVRGFARISNPAILLTVVSGAVQTFRLDGGTLFDTGHGWVLLLKAVAVGAMVFVGLASRQFIKARLARADTMSAPMAARLRRAIGVEALGGVVVLALTAWLLSLSPGSLDATSNTTVGLGPTMLINNPDVGAEVKVAFTQVVGANAVRIDVIKPVEGLIGLQVDFIAPPNSGAAAVVLDVPLTGAGTAILPLTAGLPLDAPGLWTITVRIGATPVGSKSVLVVDALP